MELNTSNIQNVMDKLQSFGHKAISIDQIQTFDFPSMDPDKRGVFHRPICVVAAARDVDYIIIEIAKSQDGRFHSGYDYRMGNNGDLNKCKATKSNSFDTPFSAAFSILNDMYHNGRLKKLKTLAHDALENLQNTNQTEIEFND